MSVRTENRSEALRKWKRELDVRCEEHLLITRRMRPLNV